MNSSEKLFVCVCVWTITIFELLWVLSSTKNRVQLVGINNNWRISKVSK